MSFSVFYEFPGMIFTGNVKIWLSEIKILHMDFIPDFKYSITFVPEK